MSSKIYSHASSWEQVNNHSVSGVNFLFGQENTNSMTKDWFTFFHVGLRGWGLNIISPKVGIHLDSLRDL